MLINIFRKAVGSNDIKIVKKLINASANIDAINGKYKHAILMKASNYGHTKIVSMLLDAGANIHSKDKGNMDAFIYTFHNDHSKIPRMLDSLRL